MASDVPAAAASSPGSATAVALLMPEDVGALIRNGKLKPGKDYQIIDVRDDDFRGGHIVSALNVPSSEFYDRLPSLLQRFAKVPHVIFHCALSQVRGPKAASLYNEAVRAHLAQAEADLKRGEREAEDAAAPRAPNRVSVLKGGFTAWQSLYRNHAERHLYIAEYDEEFWTMENEY